MVYIGNYALCKPSTNTNEKRNATLKRLLKM